MRAKHSARQVFYASSPLPSILKVVHVPAAIATLLLFTTIFVLLRICWSRLPRTFKRGLILFAMASIVLMAIASAVRISTTHDGTLSRAQTLVDALLRKDRGEA